jgi:molybdate transport system substrate-binding protein
MNVRRIVSVVVSLAAVIGVLVGQPRAANAAEIKVLCSVGLKAVMDELVPQFEQATKNKVLIEFGLAAGLKRQIEAGEPFDLAVLTPAFVDDLIKAGKVAPDTRTVIARSGLGLAIRAGGPKPNVGTVDAFKRALVASRSIAYAKEGASGVLFSALIEQLGIAQEMKPKTIFTSSGEAVGEALITGQAELGVLPVSEILPIHGIELLATFPPEVQRYIVMAGGVSTAARQAAAARDLVTFLMSPGVLPTIKAKGMER